jgi:5'-nucleotidase (lipoprotein e(P4) family)
MEIAKQILVAGAAAFTLTANAQARPAMPTYDCHAHITRSDDVPPVNTSDSKPWQCTMPTAKPTSSTQWQRHALEYCRITTTAYDTALAAAKRMKAEHHYKPRSWVVIMDADETVLDNSLNQTQRDKCADVTFDNAVWESWVNARATPQSNPGMADDVPGAAAFTDGIHKLGGLVAIVTNRAVADDAVTQDNLKRLHIWFDYEIGQDINKPSDKTSKLQRWKDAVAVLGARLHRPTKAVMWIGDQVTDLAITDAKGTMTGAMSQADEGDGIGINRFIVPNPMYGDWKP